MHHPASADATGASGGGGWQHRRAAAGGRAPDLRRGLRRDERQQDLDVVEQEARAPALGRGGRHAHARVVLHARLQRQLQPLRGRELPAQSDAATEPRGSNVQRTTGWLLIKSQPSEQRCGACRRAQPCQNWHALGPTGTPSRAKQPRPSHLSAGGRRRSKLAARRAQRGGGRACSMALYCFGAMRGCAGAAVARGFSGSMVTQSLPLAGASSSSPLGSPAVAGRHAPCQHCLADWHECHAQRGLSTCPSAPGCTRQAPDAAGDSVRPGQAAPWAARFSSTSKMDCSPHSRS